MSENAPHAHDAVPPEPQTPLWLPALGVCLFVAAAVFWATRPAPPPPVNAAASASAAPSGADAGPPTAASAR